LDITFNYGNGAYIQDTSIADTGNISKIFGQAGKPETISIHIDSLERKKVLVTSRDSVSEKEKVNTSVKSTDQQYNKVVSKTGISFWVYIIGAIVILLGIAYGLVKFNILKL
jgi:hypothetical protein